MNVYWIVPPNESVSVSRHVEADFIELNENRTCIYIGTSQSNKELVAVVPLNYLVTKTPNKTNGSN